MSLELTYRDETMEGIPKEVLESARKVGENRKAFRKMLETYVPQVGYSAPEHSRILDLGCGRCYEAHVLSDTLEINLTVLIQKMFWLLELILMKRKLKEQEGIIQDLILVQELQNGLNNQIIDLSMEMQGN